MVNNFYTITKWKGFDNFECLHCKFATLNKREMTKHIQQHIKGNPELAGLEVGEEDLPEVFEDHGLGEDVPAKKKKKQTYKPLKKDEGKGKVKDG